MHSERAVEQSESASEGCTHRGKEFLKRSSVKTKADPRLREDDEGGNEACADEARITYPSGDGASDHLPNGARK